MEQEKMPDYAAMRASLEQDIASLPQGQKNNEMYIFDMMVSLRESFDRMSESKNNLNKLMESALSDSRSDLPDVVPAKVEQGYVTLDNILDAFSEFKDLSRESGCPDHAKMHAPAFIVVLNYFHGSVHSNFIYNGNWYDNSSAISLGTAESKKFFTETAYEDNAILIDSDGRIIAKNVLLTKLDPHKLIRHIKSTGTDVPARSNINIPAAKNYQCDMLGFDDPKVHSRNKNALVASYNMPGTVVYTLAEETGHIRRMENGRITNSTAEKPYLVAEPGYASAYLSMIKQALASLNPFRSEKAPRFKSTYLHPPAAKKAYSVRAGEIVPSEADKPYAQ